MSMIPKWDRFAENIVIMAFFRTVSFSDSMPAIAGAGMTLRVPQWRRLRRMGRACARPAAIS